MENNLFPFTDPQEVEVIEEDEVIGMLERKDAHREIAKELESVGG